MLEKSDMITLPEDYKKEIRETKTMLDHIAKAEVAGNRKEYDDFVQSIESTSTVKSSKDNPSGVVKLMNVFMCCVPDYFLAYNLQGPNNLSDERLLELCKDETQFKGMTAKGIRQVMELHMRKAYVQGGVYDTRFIENFYNQVRLKDKPSVFAYYFLTAERGYQRLVRMMPGLLKPSENGYMFQTAFRNLVWSLVCTSIAVGTETKTSWRDFAEENDNYDIWSMVNWAIRFHENNQGRKAKIVPLQEMLIGETSELIERMREFMTENNESICMAYMMIALERAERVKKYSFKAFLRAVNAYFGKDYQYRKAQERYSEIKQYPGMLKEEAKSWVKAKQIIDEWTETFYRCV